MGRNDAFADCIHTHVPSRYMMMIIFNLERQCLGYCNQYNATATQLMQ